MRLEPRGAELLVQLISSSLRREYPYHLSHIMRGDQDVRPPRQLTPMFCGCFDWHSAVHSHWALVRLLRLFPVAHWTGQVREALTASFTDEKSDGELAHLAHRPGFELPYGMAWLLQLDAELCEGATAADSDMARWRSVLAPLAALAARRILTWLENLSHPIRTGEHSQSAFAMSLILDWARTAGNAQLAELVAERARRFHQNDRDAPVAYEPSAFDFLSPTLAEVDLMRRVLDVPELEMWLSGFLPGGDGWHPVVPVDRSDNKLVHFDGLNLSRAWMMRGIGLSLPDGHRRRGEFLAASAEHEAAGMEGVDGQHYAGGHWLGSFAVYLLTDRGIGGDGGAG